MDALKQTRAWLMIERAQQLSEAVAWFDAFKDENLKKYIVWLIQEGQLQPFGIDEDGFVIGYYSPATEKITGGRKKAGEEFDLKDTGDFYKSMFVDVLTDSFIVKADTDKMEDSSWYSDKILGLTDESFSKFALRLRDAYIRYARKILLNG